MFIYVYRTHLVSMHPQVSRKFLDLPRSTYQLSWMKILGTKAPRARVPNVGSRSSAPRNLWDFFGFTVETLILTMKNCVLFSHQERWFFRGGAIKSGRYIMGEKPARVLSMGRTGSLSLLCQFFFEKSFII